MLDSRHGRGEADRRDVRQPKRLDAKAFDTVPRRPHPVVSPEPLVKSATRALEVIELFGVSRGALSVSDVANALAIPQSSSSILLQAMSQAGFIDRDQKTRRYSPSLRSALLGCRTHDAMFAHESLLHRLDQLSRDTRCPISLVRRNGLHVQYVHVSRPDAPPRPMAGRPGRLLPICCSVLGAALLADETDQVVGAVIRHARTLLEDGEAVVRTEVFLEWLNCLRRDGFAEADHGVERDHVVLAVRLQNSLALPVAVALTGPRDHVRAERERLLDRIGSVGCVDVQHEV